MKFPGWCNLVCGILFFNICGAISQFTHNRTAHEHVRHRMGRQKLMLIILRDM